MKNRKNIQLIVLSLIFIFGLITLSCTKEGPVGPQGPAGANGTNGTNGTNGVDGNANVRTQLFTITTSDWVHTGTLGQSGEGYFKTLSSSIITSSIVTTGVVMVYMSPNNQIWSALPLTWTFSDYISTFYFDYLEGSVIISNEDSDHYTTNPGLCYVKVVAIAGNLAEQHPNIDWKNYNEVKKTFNLQD